MEENTLKTDIITDSTGLHELTAQYKNIQYIKHPNIIST